MKKKKYVSVISKESGAENFYKTYDEALKCLF